MVDKLLIGRSEWCALPDLSLPAIKAKIDTGAKTSALHAFDIKSQIIDGEEYVKFYVHPLQANTALTKSCCAKVIDMRYIISSNGHKEHRYVIKTRLKLGEALYDIELSLSNRDPLTFRLLLGREALSKRVIIDPGTTCLQGAYKRKVVERLYRT